MYRFFYSPAYSDKIASDAEIQGQCILKTYPKNSSRKGTKIRKVRKAFVRYLLINLPEPQIIHRFLGSKEDIKQILGDLCEPWRLCVIELKSMRWPSSHCHESRLKRKNRLLYDKFVILLMLNRILLR